MTQRPSDGMTHGGSRHDLAATIMTEDAKTEKHTAGGPCVAYIETPCKFSACRALYQKEKVLYVCHILCKCKGNIKMSGIMLGMLNLILFPAFSPFRCI